MVARKKRAKRKRTLSTPSSSSSSLVSLKPASPSDFEFAFRLYCETMEEYSSAYIAWDESKQRASLADQWGKAEVSLITFEQVNVGWLAVQETAGSILLGHFYVEPRFQKRGVGSMILSRLLTTASGKGKSVELAVLKNNPARRLYDRMGFTVTGEDRIKYYMRR